MATEARGRAADLLPRPTAAGSPHPLPTPILGGQAIHAEDLQVLSHLMRLLRYKLRYMLTQADQIPW